MTERTFQNRVLVKRGYTTHASAQVPHAGHTVDTPSAHKRDALLTNTRNGPCLRWAGLWRVILGRLRRRHSSRLNGAWTGLDGLGGGL